MTDTSTRPLAVIGAATSAGAYGPGHERAPEVLRRHGLVTALRAGGREVRDAGDVVSVVHRDDPEHPAAANVELVTAVVREVARHVADAIGRSEDVLVLGGDCTVELGTVAGAVADGANVGLVYVDLDGDLNTPASGDGVLDWMGLAHLLDLDGVVAELAAAGPRRPLLPPEAVFLVGVGNLTDAEQREVDRLRLRHATLADVQQHLGSVLEQIAAWAAEFDRVLVHLDVDVLHYPSFPMAHEVRDSPGLSIDELDHLMAGLRRVPGWASLTVCEINPDHLTDETAQLARVVELLQRAVQVPRRLTGEPKVS